MAVAALVCGIAGLVLFIVVVPSIVALVLGLIAASKAKRSGALAAGGLGMARSGWILGTIGVGLFVLVVTLAATGVIDDGEVAVTDLDPGDCVDLDVGDDEEVNELPQFDCDEPHDGEVYLVADLDIEGADDEYPGLSVLVGEIDERCAGDVFTDYVGLPYAQSELGANFLYPGEEAWERGDRGFVCIAVEKDGSQLTETVEGSRR